MFRPTSRLVLVVLLLLLVVACAGADPAGTSEAETPQTAVTEAPVATAAPPAAEAPPGTDAPIPGIEELVADLDPPCSHVDAKEASEILGTEVLAEESFGTDCFYEPTAGYGEGRLDAHLAVYNLPADDCPGALQTDPIFPGETVEPAPYGDAASIIIGNYSTEIEVCTAGVYLFVAVSGDELTDPEADRVAAEALLELLLGRI